MVFSGQIYDKVKDQLDKYLFGFDKSQLNVSLLSGAVNLKGVNIKPNKAERLLQSLSLPFSLKAGTVGALELKLSLMSMFSSDPNAMTVSLEEVFFIMGPSMGTVSKDDSYLKESDQELLEPYDDCNGFDIFKHNLRMRKKEKNGAAAAQQQQPKTEVQKEKTDAELKESQGLNKEQKDSLKGLTIHIKRLHLRYEDDFYQSDEPYSFGIVIEELKFDTSDTRLFFERLQDMNLKQMSISQMGQYAESQLCKDLNMTGVRLYWNCLSEMYIPSSLWESTRHMKYQIFEAMDAQQLNELMVQVFTEAGKSQFQFILKDIAVNSQLHCFDQQEQALEADKPRSVTSLNLKISPVEININAYILNDLQHFLERMQGQFLLRDLKQYRPHRRPITGVPQALESRSTLKRKRKLIVRDWFFFAVWHIRLKRIVRSFYQKDNLNAYLLFDPKYSVLIHQVLNNEITFDDLVRHIQKAGSEKSKQLWPSRSEVNVRVQNAALSVYDKQLFDLQSTDCPKLCLNAGQLALNFSMGSVTSAQRSKEENLALSAQIGSIELDTFSEQKNYSSQSRPKPLSQMLIKQDVVVQQSNGNQNQNQIIRPPKTPMKTLSHLANANKQRSRYQQQPNLHRHASYDQPQIARQFSRQGGQNNNNNMEQFDSSQYNSAYPQEFRENQQNRAGTIMQQPQQQYIAQQHNMPNVTSPGRLMIGPKVSNNEIMLGPQQRSAAEKDRLNYEPYADKNRGDDQKVNQLKKSSSKDSLVSNMLMSVTKFLGGGVPKNESELIPAASDSEDLGQSVVGGVSNSSYGSSYFRLRGNDQNIKIQNDAAQRKNQSSRMGNMSLMDNNAVNLNQSYQKQSQNLMRNPQASNTISMLKASPSDQRMNYRKNLQNNTQYQNMDKTTRQKGLSSLLTKGNARRPQNGSVLNSSIHSNMRNGGHIATENNQQQREMSVIMGSIESVLEDEEDIVIDSGGRQINHLNNWQNSNLGGNQMTQYQQNRNHIGANNQNVIQQNTRDHRSQSTYGVSAHQSNLHRSVNSPLQEQMGARPKPSSTLGGLLGFAGVAKGGAGTQLQTQQPQMLNTTRSATPQLNNNNTTTTNQMQVISDDTCNVLPSQVVQRKPLEKIQVVKERLFTINSSAQLDYKVVHQNQLAKEVTTDVNFGQVQLTYSNNAMKSISELLISFKSLPYFRSYLLIPSFLLPVRNLITPESAQDAKEWNEEKVRVKEAVREFRRDDRGWGCENARKKAQQVNQEITKCMIDFKVQGERLYISFFDDHNRDQVAKFVSPPVSMGIMVHPRSSNNSIAEASYEIFGFQMQQSTDLNLIGNFVGTFMNQVSMFTQHEAIRRGQVHYDEIIDEFNRKKEEKMDITRRVMRKQSLALAQQSNFSSGFGGHNTRLPDEGSAKQGREQFAKIGSSQAMQKLGGGGMGSGGGGPKMSRKPHSGAKQIKKPGKSISKLNSGNGQSQQPKHSSMLYSNQQKQLEQAANNTGVANSMVTNGLRIQECPSKEFRKNTDQSDDEVPYPQEDDESDEVLQRENLDSFSDTIKAVRRQKSSEKVTNPSMKMNQIHKRFKSQESPIQRKETAKSDTYRSENDDDEQIIGDVLDFQQDRVAYGDTLMDMQDLKSPRPDLLQEIISTSRMYRNETNNSDLRSATQKQLTQGYVQLGEPYGGSIGDQKNIPKVGPPLGSNTNTDSAGGEPGDNLDEAKCDQDEPILPKENQKMLLKAANSSGSDMLIFDDPQINRDTNKNFTQQVTKLKRPMGGTETINRIPPGLAMVGGSISLQNSEEQKRWKNTRETQSFLLKNKTTSSGSKLQAMKEANTSQPTNISGGNKIKSMKNFTPNHLLNFSKQIRSSGQNLNLDQLTSDHVHNVPNKTTNLNKAASPYKQRTGHAPNSREIEQMLNTNQRLSQNPQLSQNFQPNEVRNSMSKRDNKGPATQVIAGYRVVKKPEE